jgi:hypothetical protein
MALAGSRRSSLTRALALGLAAQFALHLVYGHDLLLYVGDWLGPQCALIGLSLDGSRRGRIAMGLLAAGLPLLVANNAATVMDLHGKITTLGATADSWAPPGESP